jgi:hypothetical protein
MPLISINGAYPISAPHRAPWKSAEGTTRTDPEQYTADAAFMAAGNAVVVEAPPAYDSAYQVLGWTGSAWTVTDKPLAEVLAARKEAVTALRYAKETGGIVLNGAAIRTDRESQALINGAKLLAEAEPAEVVDFKAASGWVSLDSATMQAIGLAVGQHVRACFRQERELHEAIDAAATVAAVQAIDITAGWPA